MSHARSDNCGDRVHFICNPQIQLHQPVRLDRPAAEPHSPVEEAIRRALG